MFSKTLFGREVEIQRIRYIYQLISSGSSCLLLISGYSGVGKTSLVMEALFDAIDSQTYFFSGKANQYDLNTPYAPISQICRELIKSISADTASLDEWRKKITRVIGNTGKLLTNIIPELEGIIGQQPDLPNFGPNESKNRFHFLFHQFIALFATAESPFIIFLDDLQWIDPASCDLIRSLFFDYKNQYLLIITAFRDRDLNQNFALRDFIHVIKSQHIETIQEITLRPLPISEVNHFVANTLKKSPDKTKDLSEALYQKTMGNPFFLKQLLIQLNEQDCLEFCYQTKDWHWDLKQIRKVEVSLNVADLIVQKLYQLPDQTRELLKMAALLGNIFRLSSLCTVYQGSPIEIALALYPTLKQDYIIQLNENEGYIDYTSDECSKIVYKFNHDKIHEAAYLLIPKEQLPEMHLKIGERLLSQSEKDQSKSLDLEMIHHLNKGSSLINKFKDKLKLSKLNFQAGVSAKQAVAFEAALIFFSQAIDLVGDDIWAIDHYYAFQVHFEKADCQYLTNQIAQADELLNTILLKTEVVHEKVKVYIQKIILFTTTHDFDRAIQAGLTGLSQLKIDMNPKPTLVSLIMELVKIKLKLKGKRIEDLLIAPTVSDQNEIVLIELLTNLCPPLYLSNQKLAIFVVLKMINHALKSGNSPYAPYAYMAYAVMLCGVLNQPQLGFRFGKMSLQLIDQYHLPGLKCKLLEMFATFINHWKAPIAASLAYLEESYHMGLESGEFYYGYLARGNIITGQFFLGLNSKDLYEQSQSYLNLYKHQDIEDFSLFVQRLFKYLLSQDINELHAHFDTKNLSDKIEESNNKSHRSNYWIFRLMIHYILMQHNDAILSASKSEQLVKNTRGLYSYPYHFYFQALIYIRYFKQSKFTQRIKWRYCIVRNIKKFKFWSEQCPQNYLHKYDLLLAEWMRVKNKVSKARSSYEDAIKHAKENGYISDTAIACECYGQFLKSINQLKESEYYLTKAKNNYTQWGMNLKLVQMQEIL